MDAGEGSAGSGVGGGEEYTLRSGGREDDRPKLPSPMVEPPREPLGNIWPCTPRTPANMGAVPGSGRKYMSMRKLLKVFDTIAILRRGEDNRKLVFILRCTANRGDLTPP